MEWKSKFYIGILVACIIILFIAIMIAIKYEKYEDLDWKAQLERQGTVKFLKAENFGANWVDDIKKNGTLQFMIKEGHAREGLTAPKATLTHGGVGVVFTPINRTMPINRAKGTNIYIPNSYTYGDKQTSLDQLYTLPSEERRSSEQREERQLESDHDYSNDHMQRAKSRIDTFGNAGPTMLTKTNKMHTYEHCKDFS